jgi:hypothetical protein
MDPRAAHAARSELLRKTLNHVSAFPDGLLGGIGYHLGPVLANKLGLQVARTLYKNIGWHLRRQPVPAEARPYVEALERDGCLAIPDFLPPETFARVQEEHARGKRELPYTVYMVEPNGVQESMLDLPKYRDAFPELWRGLVENPLVLAIVAGALRRPIRVRPRVWLRRSQRFAPEKPRGPGHVVGADEPHADRHFPTFKGFYYLNDVDESNGAFQFALGSHRMSLARIAYEYDASVRVAENRRIANWEDTNYAVLRKPTPEQARGMGGLVCTPMVGRANTLVLTNTQGFHRQGDFTENSVREAACLCFRTSEPGGEVMLRETASESRDGPPD